jgi:hypothetical protein
VREALLRLLLSDLAQAETVADELSRRRQWSQAVVLGAAWGVLPRLRQRLSALRVDLGGPARSDLRKLTAAAVARSTLRARKGVKVLEHLERRGIPAAAFKGLAAIASLYHGPQDRMIGDVDILIREEDLEAAISGLAELGFRPDLEGSLANWLAFVRRAPGFAGNEALALSDAEKCEVDLHWRLGTHPSPELETPRVIARAQTVEVLGTPVRVVSPGDGLLLSAHHAIRENLVPEAVIRNLLDIEGWCGLLAGRGELEAALERARACGLGAPLLALTSVLARFDSSSAARPAAALLQGTATREDSRAAGRLADLFLFQARQGRVSKDVVYLFHPRALRQIAASLLMGWQRHRRLMKAMETKLRGKPLPLSERLGGLVRSLLHLTPARLRMLRTLVRVKEGYQSGGAPEASVSPRSPRQPSA